MKRIISNIALDGAPHDKLLPVQLHGASFHIRNGQMIASSKTQAASNPVTMPTVEKHLGAVPVTPGMRNRTAQTDTLKPRKA